MDSPLRNLCKKAPEIFNILGALYVSNLPAMPVVT